MNTVGIIAAMDEEITYLKSKMEVKVTKSVVGADFYIGSFMGKSVVAVKCGIGKVNAAICTQALIDLFAVDYIINIGVAGGVHKDIKIGDLVISTDAVQHDFDCCIFGSKKGEIPRMSESHFKADETLSQYAKRAVAELEIENDRKVFFQRIASGDVFVASKEKKKEIWESVSAYCVEMEGAAIAQACYLNKIPFLIIRSISDNADYSGHVNFEEFVAVMAKVSSNIAEKIIEYI